LRVVAFPFPFLHLILIGCALLMVAGCAIQVSPSGGPKDTEPPIVVSSEPANYATNFSAKEIVIEFDEYVKLRDIYNNFIVSPPLETRPEIVIRGKSVVMKFDEPLEPNTTFNFNFGDAIVDIHEGNPSKNFQFVLSTGNFIDSMSVFGKAFSALSSEPVEEAWVLLYNCQDYGQCDSLPMKQLPRYLAKTDKSGFFRIENIEVGAYKVFALIDKNRNYLFDLPNESIGFIGNTIEAGDSNELNLVIFDQEDGNQKITKAWSPERGLIHIAFKQPVDQVSISALNFASKKAWEIVDYSSTKDTVFHWNTSGMDSLKLHIHDERWDFDDTVTVGINQKAEFSKLSVSTSIAKSKDQDIGKALMINPSKPLMKYDSKSIKLYERLDSANLVEVKMNLEFADEARRVLAVNHTWKPGIAYRLVLEQGALTDFFQGVSDSMSADFTVRKEDYYGNAAIELDIPQVAHTYIVQLIDAKGNEVKEDYVLPMDTVQDIKTKLVYPYIVPGKYQLKVIYDVNNSKRWESGNHLKNRQPERIEYSEKEILIRSNWDMVLDWKLEP